MGQPGKSAISRTFTGGGYLFRALSFVRGRPSMWGWVAAPAGVTAVAAGLGGWWMWQWGHAFLERHTAGHGAFVGALLGFLLFILTIGVAYVCFLAVSLIATAPFAGFISEKTERLATGAVVTPQGFVRNAIVSLGHTLLSLTIYLALAAGLFVVQFFVAPLAPFLWVANLLLTATFLAYDAWDLPLGRRDRSFAEKWATLRRHRAESLGLGLTAALLLVVPGFGLVVPPLTAVAGTLMFVELEAQTS
jgi:CysZ protein